MTINTNTPDIEAILPVAEIARECFIERSDVYNWARAGGVTEHRTENGRIAYRVGDILAVSQLRTLRKLRRLAAATA